ncbi:hypothetical protein [Erwinia phyllosphaerae]|uniref:hypothetical protein n=1 Tax=Erwinia phyllosphaerae TaxID=2853256 RepID=UPI001FEDB210|nr:hypothetical protein [Erwinia phyllosphaerae]MBV4366294.1 hypothetical protein [Erwinia phyllosphaerae]
MSLSIFAQQIESMSRSKKKFESAAQDKLTEALRSFIAETGIDSGDVFLKQDGFSREIAEIQVFNGEFKFDWAVRVSHNEHHLQASVPVYAVQGWGSDSLIFFGVGEHSAAGAVEDEIFMKKLIDSLMKGITQAFR